MITNQVNNNSEYHYHKLIRKTIKRSLFTVSNLSRNDNELVKDQKYYNRILLFKDKVCNVMHLLSDNTGENLIEMGKYSVLTLTNRRCTTQNTTKQFFYGASSKT